MMSFDLEWKLRGGMVRHLPDGVDRSQVGSEPGLSTSAAVSIRPLYFQPRIVRFVLRTSWALG